MTKYKEGELYPGEDELPEISSGLFFPYKGEWDFPVQIPKDTGALVRFRVPRNLKELGGPPKPMHVSMNPSFHTADESEFEEGIEYNMPQLPTRYPALAGFGQLGEVLGNIGLPLLIAGAFLLFAFRKK